MSKAHPYFSEHKDGVIISIKIITKSSQLGPQKVINGMLKWGVSAAPVDGKANKALIDSISKCYQIPKTSIKIIKGELSKEKIILLKGEKARLLLNS
jgi:uncharacterized protein (TIGR00251 family)